MKKITLLIFALLIIQTAARADYFDKLPFVITQPNGMTISCFVSGDEFFNWIHDKEGYTIIQAPDGYYYYAEQDGDLLKPSLYLVNSVNPANVGLTKWVKISKKEYQRRYDEMFSYKKDRKGGPDNAPQSGILNNLVVYIRFLDDTEFTSTRQSFDDNLNSSTGVALKSYFQEVSYNSLIISSTHYPACAPSTNLSYQDSHLRRYFQPYNASTNPTGYKDLTERTTREHTLLVNAMTWINANSPVPGSLNIDGDNDGYVDNVCFVIKGSNGAWNDLLWAHRWALYSQTVTINGKIVYDYTFQPETQVSVQTLCHEMFHSLGAPDLYHYANQGVITPVGYWDLMEYGNGHMLAYMKWKYSNHTWITTVPEITSSGTYTLNPLTSSSNNCYKIASPNSSDEYFMVEYRNNSGTFESSLPGSGLIVYRIDTRVGGNSNGPPDEVYVYRPDGTTTANGTPNDAFFSSTVGRNAINDITNPSSFLQNGSSGGLNISNVTTAGTTISFNVVIPPSCTPPTTQATSYISSAITNNTMTIGWTRGNGNALLVVARADNAVNADPVNGISYTANAAFGNGTPTGIDNYVVFNGTGTSLDLTGLISGTTYHFAIYEYNSADYCYKKPALTGNTKTTGKKPYCAAGSNICDEYISKVTIGTINNSSSCSTGGYSDYTSSTTDIVNGSALAINVTNGRPYSADRCGIWVDWNDNSDFLDDQAITVSGTPGNGPYTASIICPLDAPLGLKRLRVRILFNEIVSPCGNTTYGEVEDYTINVLPACTPPTIAAITHPTCTIATGSVEISGLPQGNWTINPGNITGSGTNLTISNLVSGTYNFTVTNESGCTSVASANAVINAQPATPAAPTTTLVQPTCTVTTGKITVTSPTGTGMTYSIDGSTYTNTTRVFNSVLPGTYTVTAKSSAGCISPGTTVTINTQPEIPPTPATISTQPTCSVNTGTITVTAPTGTGMTYSINGSTYTNTTGIFTAVTAGAYNVTAKNSVGCVSPATSVTINAQPATPATPTTTLTQPTCSVATGTITITAPTGTGMTYSIDGSDYTNTTGIFSSVVAGAYSVTAKSSAGCISAIKSVTISAQPVTPDAPTITLTQPTCTVTGTITITAPKGTGMTYSINGSTYTNTTGIFTSVAAGTYTVTAKGSSGCISSGTVVTMDAQPPTPATPTTTLTQPTCSEATGTITITAPTGADLTYSMDGSTYTNTTGIFTSVAAGTYSVTAKNSVGCVSAIKSVTITAQPVTPALPTITLTQPTCTVATGTITVTAPTGTGMTYSIDGSTYTNTNRIFSSVIPGTYTVTAKSSAGCISPGKTVTLNTQPVTPTSPVTTLIQPTCSTLGTITITSPAETGMTYSINGSTYTNTTGIFTSVAGGTYNVTAKNSVGCVSTATSVTINAQPATPATPTTTLTQPTCSVATGTITITAPTGTGMTYSMDGSDYTNTTGIFSSVVAGAYSVTAKSSAGCISAIKSVTITAQPATPDAPTITLTQPTCTVTGTITITAPKGTGMTYSINGSTYTNTTGIFTSVAAGTYTVTAKGSSGCISSGTVVTMDAQPPTPATPTTTLTQPTCSEATGTITITAPTGADLTYSINGTTYTNTTGIFTSVAAGTYSVTAKNSVGCVSAIKSVTITAQPATPALPVITLTQPTCTVATGTITVTSPSGTGMTYSIDGSTYTNTNRIFSSLLPGTYTVTAKSSAGCISPGKTVTLNTQPVTPASPVTTLIQPTCTTLGTITITSPAETGMTYSINGSTYTNTTGIFTSVAGGTYNVTAKNSVGCISPATSVTITAQPATPATPTTTLTQPTCSVATGTITITAPTGTGMTYSMDGSEYTNTTGIFSTVAAGTYSVTAKSSAGCISAIKSVTITAQPATPAAPTTTLVQPTCTVFTGKITVTAPTGTGMTYSINGTTYTNTTGVFTSVTVGTYIVTAKNSSGCVSSGTSVSINQLKPVTPVITFNSTILHSSAATGNQWYNQAGLINGAINQDFTPLSTGDYYVIVSAAGCSSDPSNSIHVVVTDLNKSDNIKVIRVYPNPFDNELIIEIEGGKERTEFEILNSKGQKVFKGSLFEKIIVPTYDFYPGVYVIKIENGKTFEFKKIVK